VAARLQDLDYDIVGKLIGDIEKLDSPRERIKAHLALLEYCDARRKTVELNSSIENQIVPAVYFNVSQGDQG
jgi:hypothetical protein